MATVFLVDAALESRMSLSYRLTSAGYEVRSFESAERFLEEQEHDTVGCILLEVSLPGLHGLELQRRLAGSVQDRPFVFLTGSENIPAGVQAMKAGAIDFLIRPIDDQRLFAAINQAVQRDHEERPKRRIRGVVERRLATLSRRERQVLNQVVLGRRNKQIAAELGTGEKTVKTQRGSMMCKMGARSLPELVWLAAEVGIAMNMTPGARPNLPASTAAYSNRALVAL